MKRYCEKCRRAFDDEFRTTICPHDAFAANDGKNNFRIHHESFITEPMENVEKFDPSCP